MYYLLIRIVKITISFKIHFISRNGSSENGWRWNQGLFAISWHWWILQEEGSCLEIIGGWGDWNTFSGFGGLWILHSAWRWNQYYRCCEVTICLHWKSAVSLQFYLFCRIAFAFGVTVATMAQSIGHISGCHINPAVTCGLLFGRKIGLINAFLYIIAQCVGGILGGGLLFVSQDHDFLGSFDF